MVNYSGVFNDPETGIPLYSLNAQTGYDTYVNNFLDSSYAQQGVEATPQSLGWGDFVRALDMVVKLVWNSIFGIANLLVMFGLDPVIAIFIRTLMLFIYAGGMVQFIANRKFTRTSA